MRILSIFKYSSIIAAVSLASCGESEYKSCQYELKKRGFDVGNQDDRMIFSAKLLISELHGENATKKYCYGVGNFKDRRCYRARPLNGDTSLEYVACHFIDK